MILAMPGLIVAISSIRLLQAFLNIDRHTDMKTALLTVVHVAFVVPDLIPVYLESLMSKTRTGIDTG